MLDVEKIKVLCRLKGMTQSRFADELNITQSYLSYLLNRKRKGSIEIVSSMAKVLGVNMDEIVIAAAPPFSRRKRSMENTACKRRKRNAAPMA